MSVPINFAVLASSVVVFVRHAVFSDILKRAVSPADVSATHAIAANGVIRSAVQSSD